MVSESRLIPPDLDTYIRGQMARWAVPGITVGVLHEGKRETRAYGVTSLETSYPMRPDTLFLIGSIAKVYTAALVMTLVDEGTLHLDTPVATYLPDLRLADERARDTITLRHLLSHQSGLFGDYYDDFGMGDDALRRCVASFPTLRQMTAPGELWAYCSAGFMLAGRIIEDVTGQAFEAAMRQRIFEPLGLTHSFFFAQEAMVYPTAVGHVLTTPGGDEHEVCRQYGLSRNVAPAGGVISDAGDLLTFAACFMGDGTWNGRRLLSPASLEAMLAPQVCAASFLAAGYTEWGGLGWAIRFLDHEQVVEHGGSLTGFQVKLKFVPAHRFAITILTNSSRGGVLGDHVAEWALDHLLDLRVKRPDPIVLPEAALARFVGRYRTSESEVACFIQDGELHCVLKEFDPDRDHEQTYPPMQLRPLSEREFVVVKEGEYDEARVDFLEGDEGTIRFLRLDGRLYDPVMEDAGL